MQNGIMTYRDAKYTAAEQLKNAGIENELAESGFLMEFACQIDRGFYLLHQAEEMPEMELTVFLEMAKKRCARIPLQYLTGEQEFMGLTFQVNEHVLIPRQDTEVLVETALEILRDEIMPPRQSFSEQNLFLREPKGWKLNNGFCEENQLRSAQNRPDGNPGCPKVLDLCTGSGCIAISLKAFLPEISVTAGDVSNEALAVARKNVEILLAERFESGTVEESSCLGRNINFIQSDLFSAISGRFDMIVCNPPYIPSGVIPTLMPEVREHEPLLALDGSADGLYFYRKIIAQSPRYLNDGGWLLFEIGAEQGGAVSTLLSEHGFCDIEVICDLAGLDRVVKAHR